MNEEGGGGGGCRGAGVQGCRGAGVQGCIEFARQVPTPDTCVHHFCQ